MRAPYATASAPASGCSARFRRAGQVALISSGQEPGDDAVAVSRKRIADAGAACNHDATPIIDCDRAACLVAAEVDVHDPVGAKVGIGVGVAVFA